MARIVESTKQIYGRYMSKSVAGNSNVTLSADEYDNDILEFTGALTGNISVVVPLTGGNSWIVFNNTTGGNTLTVKGSSGSGVAVTQTKKVLLYTNGSEVYAATAEL